MLLPTILGLENQDRTDNLANPLFFHVLIKIIEGILKRLTWFLIETHLFENAFKHTKKSLTHIP